MTVAEDAIADLAAKQGVENSVSPASLAATLTVIYDEIRSNSGHASYTDNQYVSAGTALTIPANTTTQLPNNAGIVYNDQKPGYFNGTEFYDGNKITGRQGDNLDIMIYFKAVPTAAAQFLDVWLDIGGAVGELYRLTFSFPKGAGQERSIMYSLSSAYTRDTWAANGATVYVRSDADVDVYGMTFNFDTSHRGLPEI